MKIKKREKIKIKCKKSLRCCCARPFGQCGAMQFLHFLRAQCNFCTSCRRNAIFCVSWANLAQCNFCVSCTNSTQCNFLRGNFLRILRKFGAMQFLRHLVKIWHNATFARFAQIRRNTLRILRNGTIFTHFNFCARLCNLFLHSLLIVLFHLY